MAKRTPEGPPPPPAVQKLRVRYARRGRLRFSSTRDFARALERALRRSGVPMAYSAGFHPHPKISYANGAPTGMASEAEFFEISVTEQLDPEQVRSALDDALPDGIDILDVVEAAPGALADRLEASRWQMVFHDIESGELEQVVQAFLAADTVEVSRMFKRGRKSFDARQPVLGARVEAGEDPRCAILTVVVRHTTPAVRPDDVLTALSLVASFAPPRPPLVTRLAQGRWDETTAEIIDPFDG
ncbi:TIGR03936 family radical SAM-associated protein [Marihabitans asiaticum]|uniref:Radical SAM-linked protein n=1 Tax=Marihabitans asiaticum TaxID=415218 RepID=A0A560W9X6_9MICO|nr:TIGR03936 family radical SAM-associated protein [Marihabitans asiaticum]TWD14412.1 radical SAM-linked protein [Marihabitans asiaticum]